MIKIAGKYAINKTDELCEFYEVNVPFDKFEDMCEDKMPIKEGDAIIRAKIEEKYGVSPEKIWVDGDV